MKINENIYCPKAVADYLKSNAEGDEITQIIFNEDGINIDFKNGISLLIPESCNDFKIVNNGSKIDYRIIKQSDIAELTNFSSITVNCERDIYDDDGNIIGHFITFEVLKGLESHLKTFIFKNDGSVLCSDLL